MKTSCGAAVMWSLTRTEDLVSRHLTHMVGKLALVVGRRSPFLSIWASPQIAWASLWHGEWLPPKQVISESKAVATTSYNSHGSHAAITATGFYLSRGQQCFSVTGLHKGMNTGRWTSLEVILSAGCNDLYCSHVQNALQNFTPLIASAQSRKSYHLNQIPW